MIKKYSKSSPNVDGKRAANIAGFARKKKSEVAVELDVLAFMFQAKV